MARSIIEELAHVPIDELREHPRNPNEGDVGAILESFEANGFFEPLVVERRTNTVLSGNHRLKACHIAGLDPVPVVYVGTRDDAHATRVLLSANAIAAKAHREPEALSTLLYELEHTDGLEGTGYTGDDLDQLLSDLAKPLADDWGDAFDGLSPEREPYKQVSFQLHDDQAAVVEEAVSRAMACGHDRAAAITVICEAYLGS